MDPQSCLYMCLILIGFRTSACSGGGSSVEKAKKSKLSIKSVEVETTKNKCMGCANKARSQLLFALFQRGVQPYWAQTWNSAPYRTVAFVGVRHRSRLGHECSSHIPFKHHPTNRKSKWQLNQVLVKIRNINKRGKLRRKQKETMIDLANPHQRATVRTPDRPRAKTTRQANGEGSPGRRRWHLAGGWRRQKTRDWRRSQAPQNPRI